MFVQAFTVLLPFLLQVTAAPYEHQSVIQKTGDCPKGVHIIGVRGTLEKPGFGALQDVVDSLLNKLPGSDSKAIDYPASGITIGDDGKPMYDFREYIRSETIGFTQLHEEIVDFVDQCPETGIVLMGYSQGAQIVGDTLCGFSGFVFPRKDPLDFGDSFSVKAVIQLGDPSNQRGIPWHVGSSTNAGLFQRLSFSGCNQLTDKWQSYCDKSDPFCDMGNSMDVHLSYVQKYRDEIVDFIVESVNTTQKHTLNYHIKGDRL